MSSLAPRLVLVTRPSELERLLALHATRSQAAFFLKQRGQDLEFLEKEHDSLHKSVRAAKQLAPEDWSIAEVKRDDLDRFLFSDRDIIVAVGQDGLVANLAKYLTGQPVIGVSPSVGRSENILTTYTASDLYKLLPKVAAGDVNLQQRCMIEAKLDDGQTLTALNELFIGHRSHQSARYLVNLDGTEELQSSSGVIVATGTGLTGWARSILTTTGRKANFAPEDRRALYFAREPWPSRTTGNDLVFCDLREKSCLSLTSRMNDGGVIFADGIEQDFLRFDWGIAVNVTLANQTLNLVDNT